MASGVDLIGPNDHDRRLSRGRRAGWATCPTTPTRDDTGITRSGEGTFVWRRSEDGWTDIVELLAPMETGACHQYLGGPRDDVQVMASIGEYGEEWWNRHGN